MLLRVVLLACALILAGQASARAAAAGARAEVGVEYDSNPGRRETIEGEPPPVIQPSPAMRATASGDAALATGARGRLSLSGSVAARAFARENARRDNVAILQGAGEWSYWFLDRTAAAAYWSYYDAFQSHNNDVCLVPSDQPGRCDDPGARDFRSLSPQIRLTQALGAAQLSFGGGYRWFKYKPLRDFDFQGPAAFLGYRHMFAPDPADEFGPDWELNSSVSLERRVFSGLRCVENDVCPPVVPVGRRIDTFTTLQLEATRTSSFLIGGGGAAYLNTSNSYGQGLIRYALYLRGAFALPWDLLLSWRAELLISQYSEALPLARDPASGLIKASIEDENRNTLRMEISRPFGNRFDVGLRYLFYTNELGTGPVDYHRHTVLLSFGATLESGD